MIDNKISAIINSTLGGIFVAETGLGHRITDANDQFYKMYGYTKKQFSDEMDNRMTDVIHHDDRKRIREEANGFIKGDVNTLILEYRIIKRDGSIGWVRSECTYPDFNDRREFLGISIDITELKEVEYRQKISEEGRKAAMKAIHDAHIDTWIYNIKERKTINVANSASDKVPYEIENMPDSIIEMGMVREDSIPDFRKFYDRIHAGETEASAKVWIKNPTSERWSYRLLIYNVQRGEGGTEGKAYGTSQDITDQFNADQKYKEEIRYRKQITGNLISYGSINLTQGTVESFNAGSYEICKQKNESDDEYKKRVLGYFRNTFVPYNVKNRFSIKEMQEAFEKGITEKKTEFPAILHSDGSYIWVSSDCRLMRRPGTGDVIAFLYNYDWTREHNMKEILSACMKLDYDFVGMVNTKTGKARIEDGKAEMKMGHRTISDYDKFIEGIVGDETLYSDSRDRDIAEKIQLANLIRELECKDVFTQEINMVDYGGVGRRKQLRFIKSQNDPAVLIMTCIDVEDFIKEEIRKQEILQRTLEEAKQANEAKNRFLGQMSHDIRTPMNAILGMIQIAKCEEDREALVNCLTNIELSGKFLLSLINDILNISRIESSGLKLNKDIQTAKDFEEDVRANILPIAQNKGVNFTYDLDDSFGRVYTDSLKLNKIFFNLLSNAIKFTGEGGNVSLTSGCFTGKNGKLWIKFTVQDDGVGMSDEFISHAFEPFAREQEEDMQWQGTGLGLSIVQYYVTAMGGTVDLTSREGEGTRAEVILPMVHAKTPETVQCETHSTEKNEESEYTSLSGKRVLLAEDNHINTIVATRLLEHKGVAVESVADGKAAVSAFEHSPDRYFDAILMDIRMPVMDGLEAAETIRALPREDALTVPIVAMTANAFESDRQKSYAAGMNAHITKPIDVAQLYSTLEEIMG